MRADGRLGEKLVAADKNDFAPRLGIAWNPNSRWVVRTGAGVFYSQDTGNPRFDMSRNLAGRRRDESTPDQIDLTWPAVSECGRNSPDHESLRAR